MLLEPSGSEKELWATGNLLAPVDRQRPQVLLGDVLMA